MFCLVQREKKSCNVIKPPDFDVNIENIDLAMLPVDGPFERYSPN